MKIGAVNVLPEADDNWGPLVLHTLDILDEAQTKELSSRCEVENPKKTLEQGSSLELLVSYIKNSKKLNLIVFLL